MSLPSLQSAVLPRTATSASFPSFRSGRRLQLSCVRSDHFSGIECFVAACESKHGQATHLTDLQWGIRTKRWAWQCPWLCGASCTTPFVATRREHHKLQHSPCMTLP